MSTTGQALIKDRPATLDEHEFDIPCEWEDSPCYESAAVMCKGCSDDHGRALCLYHLAALRRWFYSHSDRACVTCHRPFMHFSTHYGLVNL